MNKVLFGVIIAIILLVIVAIGNTSNCADSCTEAACSEGEKCDSVYNKKLEKICYYCVPIATSPSQ